MLCYVMEGLGGWIEYKYLGTLVFAKISVFLISLSLLKHQDLGEYQRS